MRVLLIGDSPDFDTLFIATCARSFDLIVVTDGAVHKLPSGVAPSIVCGDFDSLDPVKARQEFPNAEFISLEDQDQNDLEKGLDLVLSRGASEITIVSSFGGRFDASLANLSVLIRHHTACALSMVHRGMVARVLSDRGAKTGSFSFEARTGASVSCIPMDGAAVVSLSNVKWELARSEIRSGSHGVSNEALGGGVVAQVHQGLAVLVYEVV